MDMVMLTVDHRKVLLAHHLVNYGFIRELIRRDYTIIEVPVEEYWDLALNGVSLSPGKVIMNAGSPIVVRRLSSTSSTRSRSTSPKATSSRSQASTPQPSSSSATRRRSKQPRSVVHLAPREPQTRALTPQARRSIPERPGGRWKATDPSRSGGLTACHSWKSARRAHYESVDRDADRVRAITPVLFVARVECFRDCAGHSCFLDHEICLVRFYDELDRWKLVAWHDEESVTHRPNVFVLGTA